MPSLACAGLWATALAAGSEPLKVRVVVLSTFVNESRPWFESVEWSEQLPFLAGGCGFDVSWNRSLGLLHACTGMGPARSAAAVAALGFDPRFDLTDSVWMLAGIGGADPNVIPLASANWAPWIVDGDNGFYFDPREPAFPAGWEDGWLPASEPLPAHPYDEPPPALAASPNAFELNRTLVDWAYGVTQDLMLPDDAELRRARAEYATSSYAAATDPPRVVSHAALSTSRYWAGAVSMSWARKWTNYWTGGRSAFGTSAEEDSSVATALSMVAATGRARDSRQALLVLRAVSNYAAPPESYKGDLRAWFDDSRTTAAFTAACYSAYRVGFEVVLSLQRREARTPSPEPTSNPSEPAAALPSTPMLGEAPVTFKCVDGQCIPGQSGISRKSCQALCIPAGTYKCVGNQCVADPDGVSKDICAAFCGASLV